MKFFFIIAIVSAILPESNSSLESEFELGLFENTEWTKDILKKEIDIVEELRYLKEKLLAQKGEFDEIYKYTKKKENSSDIHIDHPVNAYNLIKRHVAIFSRKRSVLETLQNDIKTSQSNIQSIIQTNFTRAEDLEGAMNGIVILKDTYQFDENIFVKENAISINELQSKKVNINGYFNFEFQDYMKMADICIQRMWYDTAIQFTRMAAIKLKISGKGTDAMKDELKRMKKNLREMNNKWLLKTQTVAGKVWKVMPYLVNKNLYKAKKQPLDPSSIEYVDMATDIGREHQFRSVCRDFTMKKFVFHEADHALKCHLLHHKDPYLKLGPHLLEVVNESPYVTIFHKIINEKEMEEIKFITKPNLSRERPEENKYGITKRRKNRYIQQTVKYWFNDIQFSTFESDFDNQLGDHIYNKDFNITNPTIRKMSSKLEIATGGMNITSPHSASKYQATNYGLGGQCETHVDPAGYWDGKDNGPGLNAKLKVSGDQLATMMSWVSPEPIGGSTAFITPLQEILVYPTKGSMAFWFNLKKSGSRDMRTLHGGCPILKGTKWIVNKWVYQFDQWMKFPCGLEEDEFHTGFKDFYKSVSKFQGS